MKADDRGRLFIKQYEGFSTKPYLCTAGVPTIGYGSTMYPNGKRVTMKDKEITQAEAEVIFNWHLSLFERDVTFLTKTVVLTRNMFNAVLSFAYNVGTDIDQDDIPEGLGDSTLLKLILNNPSDPAIAKEFAKWNKSNGKVTNGLVNRRAAEAKLYFQ